MRIVHVISGLSTGGAEMMLFKLLSRMDRGRFESTVVSLTDEGEMGPRIAALGVKVVTAELRRGALPTPAELRHLRGIVARERPHVVQTWMHHADLLGGVVARSVGGVAVVWGLRNSMTDLPTIGASRYAVVRACAALSRVVPDRIVSCSARGRAAHVRLGYDARRIDVIPNGFDLSQFRPDEAASGAVRAELGLAPGSLLVGAVGRYHPLKNYLGLLDAARAVQRSMSDVHFVLVGAEVDWENAELSARVRALGLEGRVQLLGRRTDIPRVMAAFDVFVLSSDSEGFPNVVGEAMASGVPCVVTDAGDSADIVGDTGRVVPVGDMTGLAIELSAVLALPEAERRALGMRALERVRARYEIGAVVRAYERLYEELARDRSAARERGGRRRLRGWLG